MTDMTVAINPRSLANERGSGHIATLRQLLPYLWPAGRADLRWRVVVALIALFASKVVTVWAPFAFKDAVDILSAKGPLATAVSVTVALILSYALARIMMVVLAQIRDGLFARVGQNAVRELSVITFRHLHALSLRFHLERRTGGLSRIISRGTQGIDTLLRYSLFNTFPTLIELAFVCGILAWRFGWLYAVVTFVTVIVYIVFTYTATEWRIGIRRTMNDADTDANTKAVDSLLNFETVKYFGNEEHEARRFGVAMDRYEQAPGPRWRCSIPVRPCCSRSVWRSS
jgi:ATP-binding cassette, subfamily B, heavy metal transporter